MCDHSFFQEARMPDPDSDRKRDLECLRLASEITELATATLNPALKAHCVRMAGVLTDRVIEIVEELPTKPPIVVLVVEDDPLLRMLATDVVLEAGYVSLEADDADQALALLEARPDIALLFTDIDMPGSMDGLKLAHAVSDRWPPIKILVVSGKVCPTPTDLPSNGRFIAKPYPSATLVGELRALLGDT
jgi:CheY-like chemotaxis protein